MADKKKSPEQEEVVEEADTRVLNPNTDTLLIDLQKAKSSDAILVTIRGTPQGKKHNLNTAEAYLGRDKNIEIQINDGNVSRKHSKITRKGTDFYIEDCDSRNGTFINDKKIDSTPVKLSKEDMIRIGSTVLKYIPAGELEALYHLNLANAAYVDKLTKVYNRNYISEVLEAEFKRAKGLHTPFSIILFDIDNFKKVNDTYGHDGGDYVLTELAQEVKNSNLRDRDLVGRYGGEEFLVILGSANMEQAKEVSERIRKKVETHKFVYDGVTIPVTISLGVASLNDKHPDHNDLYKEADKALYVSKKTGKNKTTAAD